MLGCIPEYRVSSPLVAFKLQFITVNSLCNYQQNTTIISLFIVLKVIAVEQVEDEIEIRTKVEFEKFEKKLEETDEKGK